MPQIERAPPNRHPKTRKARPSHGYAPSQDLNMRTLHHSTEHRAHFPENALRAAAAVTDNRWDNLPHQTSVTRLDVRNANTGVSGQSAPSNIRNAARLQELQATLGHRRSGSFSQAAWDASCCAQCGNTIEAGAPLTLVRRVVHCDACAPELNYRHAVCTACLRPLRLYSYGFRKTWCCERCTQVYYNRRRPKIAASPIACFACGRVFAAPRSDAKFCSDACRQRAYRARKGRRE